MQPAMYEVIVEKYKGRNLHYTVKIQLTRYFFVYKVSYIHWFYFLNKYLNKI